MRFSSKLLKKCEKLCRADRTIKLLAELSQALARMKGDRGGSCGKLLFVGNAVVGYAQYAPAQFLPGAREYPAGPVSEDAVLLACLFIPKPKFRGRGLGSLFLEAILEELSARGIQAVETFARRGSAENPSGPVEFYLRHGFSVLRDDPEFPLLRRDLIPH